MLVQTVLLMGCMAATSASVTLTASMTTAHAAKVFATGRHSSSGRQLRQQINASNLTSPLTSNQTVGLTALARLVPLLLQVTDGNREVIKLTKQQGKRQRLYIIYAIGFE